MAWPRVRPPGAQLELADGIDEEARRSGTTVSAWIAETAGKRLRLEAGLRAVAEWEAENGAFTPEELAEADARVGRMLYGEEPGTDPHAADGL